MWPYRRVSILFSRARAAFSVFKTENADLTAVSASCQTAFVTQDEPLFGFGCQESVRDLVPFLLTLLTRFFGWAASACISAA